MSNANAIKVEFPEPFIVVKTDKRAGGWQEIGVYVAPVLPKASNILAAVVTHPCAGGKWIVHYGQQWRADRCSTRKAAMALALDAAKTSAAYITHHSRKEA